MGRAKCLGENGEIRPEMLASWLGQFPKKVQDHCGITVPSLTFDLNVNDLKAEPQR